MTAPLQHAERPEGLERVAWLVFLGFIAALQVSIAAAHVLLAITAVLWLTLLVRNRERVEVPGMFWPLAVYAGATVVAAVFSVHRGVSFADTKQLVLFAIIPIAYRLLPGRRSLTAVDVIITVGAIEAVVGIVQYAIFDFDNLGQRVQGSLTHYMTYSGVLMLVACTAAARIMFRPQDKAWASIVMPALLVALALTMSRNAWVGVCAGIGLLFLLRDFRLVALLPVAAALFISFAPAPLTDRLYSTFNLEDPTNRDRVAMMRSGWRMIKDHPLTGVGPDAIRLVYPTYRDPRAERQLNPHLHNVPLQIAAERGLPALAIWLWFIVVLIRDMARKTRSSPLRSLPTAALAGVCAMLAAGMFEYNFGDSEFLMLFLLLVTLPYAADRLPATTAPAVAQRHAA
ncbi:MAG: O-antigen ligase family protein [Acidobacteria bacterium]|nr:O-antigen ligase family protein [Acidobacteriota bacterium]